MKKTITLLIISVLFSSCKMRFVSPKEAEVFKILNKVSYQHQEVIDVNTKHHTLADFLNENDLLILENWKSPEPILENFNETECAGCSSSIKLLKPIYKVTKGKFIHFGLKKSMGIENLVFKKKGAFVTHFYTYQGYSKPEMEEELKKGTNANYNVAGIYPTKTDETSITLKHKDYSDQTMNGDWYNTPFHLELDYYINLKEKQPNLRFKFSGGYFSYQKEGKNIHFFEPSFVSNAVSEDEMNSYSSYENGYYGDASFFLMSLEEKIEVSIKINAFENGKEFQFSVFENNTYLTIDEYLNKESPLQATYNNTLEKGDYLIRVVNKDPGYDDKPLFRLEIKKTKLR